ncbi:hypothetical protein M2451_002584 [Dysgonomonas sp. PFB1-18]|uniref:hypothetical protein n=1 Tax=unclassified Dysgonomonas TaxID=2630389 RepID=UPI0024756FF5|nr:MULTISPECIES: hypothetical protein [unclassified Dysgonomonas]MDH6308065.1 hypothetical protein [Dysgonomonas sp. PF1-14]MDH6339604.1 hypothetical protein [Dysgonomonas sp. PF1-16]MDH6381255.1 hypothetical protein [Dysgonomonas sp. PFB1-18]MDH6398467.1 hypothetical protein [Dysgonomonas sp. PF1-23]
MENELYKIRSFLIGVAESGAARVLKDYNPKGDRLTQRQAFEFFKQRDTQFGGEFTHGEAWVRRMVEEGHLHPVRLGKAKNSPLYYSKAELLAVRAACDAYEMGIFNGTKL